MLRPEVMTVCYPLRNDQIILGKKRKGWGVGFYNGFGGHVKRNEKIITAARRELFEESSLRARAIMKCGIALMTYELIPKALEIHFFIAAKVIGEAKNSDEMEVATFAQNKLPKKMWPSDKYILPLFISGKKCMGWFHMNNPQNRELIKFEIEKVAIIPTTIPPQAWQIPQT